MSPATTPTLWNVSLASLSLPDGMQVLPGGSFSLTQELADNEGVQSWKDEGFISDEDPALHINEFFRAAIPEAENKDLLDEVARLTAELAAMQNP